MHQKACNPTIDMHLKNELKRKTHISSRYYAAS